MNKKNTKAYLFLFVAVLLLLSIPAAFSEKLRGYTMAFFSPLWGSITQAKSSLLAFSGQHESSKGAQELQYLQLENKMLRDEITRLRELFQHEKQLSKQANLWQRKGFPKAVPARVIFRSPFSWNSSFWINVGNVDNIGHDNQVICKNSPVLLGASIVGVIDYVGHRQSRVRLITDSGLSPSVRVARGQIPNQALTDQIDFLINRLSISSHFFSNNTEKETFQRLMNELKTRLKKDQETWYLAKGELRGHSKPLWRSQGDLLRGIGFNYDFADEAGEARDLRTGAVLNSVDKAALAMPLIKINDLLVTTGMDGVFPPGLQVAEVTKIELLKEGDYYYELEAKPTAGNLNELSIVFVIPPLGYDFSDQPPLLGR